MTEHYRFSLLLLGSLVACCSSMAQPTANLPPSPICSEPAARLTTAAFQNPPAKPLLNRGIYRTTPWLSGSIFIGGAISNSLGFSRLQNRPELDLNDLDQLSTEGIWRIDRSALFVDLSQRERSRRSSDQLLNLSVLSPVILLVDRKVRSDWATILLIYAETQMINSNLYTWGPYGPSWVRRFRPAVYYEDLPLEDRLNGGNRHSFFSGHVSSTATGTFFTAKVLADHHPEWGAKRWLLYGLAGIPPTMMAILRVRALRHFPTDTIIGGLTGVLVGIGIPELHRRWKNKVSLSAIWQEEAKGLALVWKF